MDLNESHPKSSEEVDINEEDNPFSPENVQVLQFITLARIYDVLMVNLQLSNPEAAKQVLAHHKAGTLLGPQPVLNGIFLSDEPDSAN